MIETFEFEGELLAYLVRAGLKVEQSRFLTAPEESFQLGLVVTPAGGEVARHRHRRLERRVGETSEVIVIRSGRCLVDLYSTTGVLAATRELTAGDTLLLLRGAHGFRMLEQTVLLDVKQGPYAGADDKEHF